MDQATDSPDVLRELGGLKKAVNGKKNVRIVHIRSFEFSLLSFQWLEEWVFAEEDELKEKRQDDDICALDKTRLTADKKRRALVEHSVLQAAFAKVGLA